MYSSLKWVFGLEEEEEVHPSAEDKHQKYLCTEQIKARGEDVYAVNLKSSGIHCLNLTIPDSPISGKCGSISALRKKRVFRSAKRRK